MSGALEPALGWSPMNAFPRIKPGLPVIAAAASAVLPCTALPLVAQQVEEGEGDGEALYEVYCSRCHSGGANDRAPSPEALGALSPDFVVIALTSGAMRLEGSRIGGSERRAIAEYLTGREFGGRVEFETVNGIPGCGASILGPGPAIAGGMVLVNSGYGSHQGRRGNVLLAFGLQ